MLRTAIVAAIASIIGLESTAAARCEPAVRVAGNDELAREVSRDLVFYGITEHTAAGCPVVEVEVEPSAAAIHMTITDPYGTTQRSVGAASTAAAIAASWAEDLVATMSIRPPSEASVQHEREDASPTPRVGGISVQYEMALESNRLRWSSGVLAACITVGPFCVGGLGRVGTATAFHPDITRLVPILTRGSGGDLVATVAMAFRAGRFVVAPELDVGLGSVHYEWEYDPASSPDSTQVASLRLGARVSASLPLGDGFAIDTALGIDALPAHYIRYDDPMPPVQRFQIDPTVRFAIGVRH